MTHPRTITIQSSPTSPASATYRQHVDSHHGIYRVSVGWSGSKRLANALAGILLALVGCYYVLDWLGWGAVVVLIIPAIWLAYVTVNRTQFELSKDGLRRSIGPLPWPSSPLGFDFADLESFVIVRHARKVSQDLDDDGGWLGPFAGNQARETRVVEKWELAVCLKNAPQATLSQNLQRDEAYALVEALNQELVRLKKTSS